MKSSHVLMLVMMGLFSLVGCGGGNQAPSRVMVSGTVTLNGSPMEGGEARFAVEGEPVQSLEIKDGKFSGEAYVGQNKIGIVWEKEGEPNPMDPTQRIIVNTVDAKFSGPNTPFVEDIKAEGASDLQFSVTSAR